MLYYITSVLLGAVYAGFYISKNSEPNFIKHAAIGALGIVLCTLGDLWGEQFPIISAVVFFIGASVIGFSAIVFLFILYTQKEKEPEKEPEPVPTPEAPAIDYTIDNKTRFRHTLILGMTGAGKSVLLTDLVLQDFKQPCSVIVFDSKGDLVQKLMKVDIPRDRIVLIDPTDVDHPLALSLFTPPDTSRSRYEQEQHLNTTIELLTYTLTTMGAATTAKQDLPLRMLIRLCLVIPQSTIFTLYELLTPAFHKYTGYIPKLPQVAQAFFQNDFHGRHYAETKEQLLRRITAILENEALARMFSSPVQKLNMGKVLDEGSIVLVNTAKSFLKEDNSAFLSRFIISLISNAVGERSEGDNMPTFLYVDEAAPIVDASFATLLETSRSKSLGVTLAFQQLSQLPNDIQDSIITNTATKYLGSISAKDARRLAPEINTHHERLMATPKFTFYQSVKDGWSRLYKAERPELTFRKDLRELIAENRAKYCMRVSETERREPPPQEDIERHNRA